MKSSSSTLRVIGLPLFSVALALGLVSHQYVRRNQYRRELKEIQTEYARLSKGMSAVSASASAMFSGSYPHEHSASEEEAPHTDAMAPAPLVGETVEEENRLFLTPGGVYTQADIEANGKMPASKKFTGLVAKHHMHPKSGQRICPVTNTLANPQFAWVIGGRNYTFCCPPCVREFVSKAKKQKQALPPPESYTQR